MAVPSKCNSNKEMMHLEIWGYHGVPRFHTLAPQPQSFSKPTRPIFSAALEVPVAIQEVRSPGPRLL